MKKMNNHEWQTFFMSVVAGIFGGIVTIAWTLSYDIVKEKGFLWILMAPNIMALLIFIIMFFFLKWLFLGETKKKPNKEHRFQILLTLFGIILASILIPLIFERYHYYREQKNTFNHLEFETNNNLQIIQILEKEKDKLANTMEYTSIRLQYAYLEKSLDYIDNETNWITLSRLLSEIKLTNSFMDMIKDMDTTTPQSYSILKVQYINTLISNLIDIEKEMEKIEKINSIETEFYSRLRNQYSHHYTSSLPNCHLFYFPRNP